MTEPKGKEWETVVELLSRIASRFPQAAYTVFVFCFQCEWEYMTRVVPDVAPYLDSIEDAMCKYFLLALFDVPPAFGVWGDSGGFDLGISRSRCVEIPSGRRSALFS